MSLAPPKASPLVPGYRLDRYELLCPIAQGGMASVWMARMRGKHGFEKLVAIKTILPQYASDHRFEQMFLDEARIASGIEHANVAQILDLGDERGVLYLVMEWIDGDALSKLHREADKRRARIPFGISLRVMADACAGLHAAHELRDKDGTPLGVVHRDVSPQNILVSARGIAKVIDFGIAKARARLSADTNTGFLKGKVQYMAPEQAFGQATDRRADVWAAGAILYHLFTGHPPFEADNQLATLHLLSSGKPPMPLPSDVPSQVSAIVMKALAQDPNERFATCADMQRAIEAAMLATNLTTTTSDVSDYAEAHISERAEARKKSVQIALEAAEERARVEKLLTPGTDSTSSVSQVAPPVNLPPMDDPHASGKLTIADVPHPGGSAQRELELLAQRALAETSSATLGSAALDPPEFTPRPSRGKTFAAFAGGALVTAIVAMVALRGGRAPERTMPASATPPPPAETVPAVPAEETAPNDHHGNAIPVEELPAAHPSATSTAPTQGGPPPAGHARPRPAPHPAVPAKPKTVDDGF